MILKTQNILLFALLLVLKQAAYGQNYESTDLKNEIKKIIKYDTQINFDKTPGFIISVIDGDSTYYLSFGEPVDSSSSLNFSSQFELGGTSKIFSSIFFLDWLEKSEALSLNTSLSELNLGFNNSFINSLTISDLIFNRTSFPKRPLSKFNLSRIENPYQNYSWEDLMVFLEKTETTVASENSAYSHINYGVLQYLFENTSSTSFNKSIEAYLNDLGFNNTNCNLDSMFTWGINLTGEIAKPWHLQSFQASEGLFSNSYDLSQYLQDLMLNRSYLRYLKTEARKSIYRPSFQLTAGWSIITGVGKFDIFAITGKTSGHSSFIAFIPETKTAVSILCNSAEGTDDLGMLILRMINNNFKREHG